MCVRKALCARTRTSLIKKGDMKLVLRRARDEKAKKQK